jgi:hypothetical protein
VAQIGGDLGNAAELLGAVFSHGANAEMASVETLDLLRAKRT